MLASAARELSDRLWSAEPVSSTRSGVEWCVPCVTVRRGMVIVTLPGTSAGSRLREQTATGTNA